MRKETKHTRMLSCLLCWPHNGLQTKEDTAFLQQGYPSAARPLGLHVTMLRQDVRQTMALKMDLFDWPMEGKCDAF